MSKPNFSKGLIPAIITDYQTKEVLMLAYMNEESYEKTLATNRTWFYSRSRKELWNKGATSGHFQYVKEIKSKAFNNNNIRCIDIKNQNVKICADSFAGNIISKIILSSTAYS